MRYDAILFDLDGTLTASAPGIAGSVRHTLDKLGLAPLSDAELQKFVGPPLGDSFERIGGLTPKQAELAVATYRAHYSENGILDATVYPGIPNLLRQLKAQGVYLAVATAKPLLSAQRVLAHFGLDRFFDRVIGATFERSDPSKESLLRDALPARYSRAAMVGDRLFDMEAAKRIGLDAFGAGWGYGSHAELIEAGADAVAASPKRLAPMLLGQDASPPEGFFITIEGLDGSGKTTQMNAVASHMTARGYDVVLTREPGGAPIAEELRSIVLDPERAMHDETEVLIYAAARAEHVRERIRPSLAQGKVVLCDRFVDSSIAYQGAGRELGMDRVKAINAFAIGGTVPDLTLLFVIDAQTALLRRSSATKLDRIERSGEEFFRRVYDGYAKIASENPRVRCIDACRDTGLVTKDTCKQIDRLLSSR